MNENIVIRGARQNNLKNVSITLPRNKMIVFTGLSGSGKSSLAFDTLYAEGQRRYVESLSSYARLFLGQMDKPDVDSIDGLSPAISIDQKTTSHNPRSTVGTVTEIYDYLRLLWARIGIPHCPKCGKPITSQSIDQIIDSIKKIPEGTKIQILAPVARGRKGEYAKVFEDAQKNGYVRVRVDGEIRDLSEEIKLEKNKKHTIEVVVDRIVIKQGMDRRLTDSVETAANLAGGIIVIDVIGGEELTFSQNYACDDCGISIEEPAPRTFSFNNPYGACPECMGLGALMRIDRDLIIPDKTKSIADGAIVAPGWTYNKKNFFSKMYYDSIAKDFNVPLDKPVGELTEEQIGLFLYGTNGYKFKIPRAEEHGGGYWLSSFEGIIPNLERRYREAESDEQKTVIDGFMSAVKCPCCGGRRLKKEVLGVTVGGKNISEYCDLNILEASRFMRGLELDATQKLIGARIIKEVLARLDFLKNVGLDYLTLSRPASTLSGGESQRIRLATQIGSALTGVLYILDEPSIGLHQRDNEKLLEALKNLRDLGNTLVVVEHDEDTMRTADMIVDIGPGAGVNGGKIVASGTVEDIIACKESYTGKYLSGELAIPVPTERRKGSGKTLKVFGARENNLKNIDVEFPLGCFICVTGVSGSGKSSLVNKVLYTKLACELNRARAKGGNFDRFEGIENLDKVIVIDQSPIGRTPRSNPATYVGLFTDIRDIFAATQDARSRGYGPGRFSFNVKGGRCESCSGDGLKKIEMHFLPDVFVPCEVCKGKRYNRETLEVRYNGYSISDVLDMSVEEALVLFENIPRIRKKLETLVSVGLGYIRLGQSSTTLSGGEAQRVKLSTELSRRSTGRTVYILDEPTTGLHSYDVHRLTEVLQKLVDEGNTVIVIEHNMDVIKSADHIIDLGPEGGDAGGEIVCTGTPEEVAANEKSWTGKFLKKYLNN